MSDRWFSEIELQKTYSLSPRESFCVIGAENGLSSRELAEYQGISVSAVNTTLHRARDKMKNSPKMVRFEVLKGNNDLIRDAVKNNDMVVLFKFVEKVIGKPARFGKIAFYSPRLRKDAPGNAQWLRDNVFRYVDINGTTGPAESEKRAERAYQRYLECDPPENVVGTAILMYYAEQYGMRYDIYDEEE